MKKGELNAVQQMTTSPGWKLLIAELQDRIDEVENELCASPDPLKNEKTYTQYDLLRTERAVLKELTELPVTIMNSHGEYEIGEL